jgi:hypothetical protein
MPLLWARCTANPDHLHELNRPLAMWPDMPTCPDCGAATEHDMSVGRRAISVEPVLLFRGPDGQIRFVGDAHGISAHDYAQKGYERIEIRGAAEMRRFERHMNAHEYSQAARKTEEKQRQRELRESQSRSELRRLMSSMTPFGRSLAREAMRRADARPVERTRDPGFHSDVYNNDRSNRDESRDAQGRKRRD